MALNISGFDVNGLLLPGLALAKSGAIASYSEARPEDLYRRVFFN